MNDIWNHGCYWSCFYFVFSIESHQNWMYFLHLHCSPYCETSQVSEGDTMLMKKKHRSILTRPSSSSSITLAGVVTPPARVWFSSWLPRGSFWAGISHTSVSRWINGLAAGIMGTQPLMHLGCRVIYWPLMVWVGTSCDPSHLMTFGADLPPGATTQRPA